MSQQLHGLKARAFKHEQDVKYLQKKKTSGLKRRAQRHEQQYYSWKKDKKKQRKESVFEESDAINSMFLDVQSFTSSQKIKSTTPAISSEKKGLPSPYECAERLKEHVHFINYNESLYYFNGKCYDRLTTDDIITLYRNRIDKTMGYERNLNIFGHVAKTLSTDSSIKVKRFEMNKHLVVLRNGIYDVEREKLRPHTHKEIVFSYVDADYVEDEKCKHFDKFIYDVTEGNKVLQERLWMFLGYILMQTLEAKVFFIMGEAPDSGKSLLGNFIESIFPPEYVSNIALNDMNKGFSVAPIAGSAINISLDLPSTRLNAGAVSKLKMLTGGDSFNINEKYEKEYRYENRAKLIFASNFPIGLLENDNAFWNRLVYLPFNKSVPKSEQDRDLLRKFKEEKNAIVSKALRYAKKLIDADFVFPTTPYIECKLQEWQGKTCLSVEKFLGDCCLCGDECRGELVDTLYLTYEQYCNYAGYVAKPRHEFKKFMEEQIGLKHFKMRFASDNPRSAFRGIKIISHPEEFMMDDIIASMHDNNL